MVNTNFNPDKTYEHFEYKTMMENICIGLNTKLTSAKIINSWYSGSTGILVLIHEANIVCANVGDSRAGIVKSEGTGEAYLEKLSRDHTPGEPDERERVLKAGGKIMACMGRQFVTET